MASRWPERSGPLPGRLGVLGRLLPLARFVHLQPGGTVEAEATRTVPALVPVARRLAGDRDAGRLSLDELLAAYGPELDACVPPLSAST